MITRRDALKWGAIGLVASPNVREAAAQDTPSGPTQGTFMPMFKGDSQRTGVMPGPGPSTDQPIIRKWRAAGGDGFAPAVYDSGRIFIGGSSLRAYTLESEEPLWRIRSELNGFGIPTVHDGVVYAGDDSEKIYAVDAHSGSPLWTFTAYHDSDFSPVVQDGVVYVCSTSYGYTALGAKTYVYALDAASGQELWQFQAEESLSVAPALLDGVLVFGCWGKYYALESSTGTVIWEYPIGDQEPRGVSLFEGSALILGGYLIKLDLRTGEEYWRTEHRFSYGPLVHNGLVYTGQGSWIGATAFESGVYVWNVDFPGELDALPCIADGKLYATQPGGLYAFHLDTAQLSWAIDSTLGTPVVADGLVINGGHYGLSVFGNQVPTKLNEDVILRVSPSNVGLEIGSAQAGDIITTVGSREERNNVVWVEVTIGSVTGWIPFDSIDPATLPPEGDIISATIYD